MDLFSTYINDEKYIFKSRHFHKHILIIWLWLLHSHTLVKRSAFPKSLRYLWHRLTWLTFAYFLFECAFSPFLWENHVSASRGSWWGAVSSHSAGTRNTKGCSSPWIRSQPPNQPFPTPPAPLLPWRTTGRGQSPGLPAPSQNPELPPTLRWVCCSFANCCFFCDLVLSGSWGGIKALGINYLVF